MSEIDKEQLISDKINEAAALLKEAAILADQSKIDVYDCHSYYDGCVYESVRELFEGLELLGWSTSSMKC